MQMAKLSAEDLQAYMHENGIPGEILRLDVPTPTVESAAQAVGCQTEQIVKSILFMAQAEPVLTITCGIQRVERRVIARRYAVGRKKVKLADADTVLSIGGYEVGAMPPFGHLQALKTLLDQGVLEHAEVYAGGGSGNALVRMAPQDILKFSQAEVLDLHTWPRAA